MADEYMPDDVWSYMIIISFYFFIAKKIFRPQRNAGEPAHGYINLASEIWISAFLLM